MTEEEMDGIRERLVQGTPLTEAQCMALTKEVVALRRERQGREAERARRWVESSEGQAAIAAGFGARVLAARSQPASAIEEPAAPAPDAYWYDRVRAERECQERKWDPRNDGDGGWTMILMAEVGELCQAALEGRTYRLQEELVQAAAVIMAWLEATGRR